MALSLHEGEHSNVLGNQAYAILRVVTYTDVELIGILSRRFTMSEAGVDMMVKKDSHSMESIVHDHFGGLTTW